MSDVQDQFELNLPDGLANSLRGAYGHRLDVPPRVDVAILTAAGNKFDRRRRIRLLVRWGAAITSAAAAIVVVLLLMHRTPNPTNQLANLPATKPLKGDIDASGQLDIVDAMTLARHLRAGDPSKSTWDINGDAAVDQRDVDALATAAVSLKQQGLASRRLPSMDQLGLARIPSVNRIEPNQADVASLNVQPEERQ
jgi:hypothetical protein